MTAEHFGLSSCKSYLVSGNIELLWLMLDGTRNVSSDAINTTNMSVSSTNNNTRSSSKTAKMTTATTIATATTTIAIATTIVLAIAIAIARTASSIQSLGRLTSTMRLLANSIGTIPNSLLMSPRFPFAILMGSRNAIRMIPIPSLALRVLLFHIQLTKVAILPVAEGSLLPSWGRLGKDSCTVSFLNVAQRHLVLQTKFARHTQAHLARLIMEINVEMPSRSTHDFLEPLVLFLRLTYQHVERCKNLLALSAGQELYHRQPILQSIFLRFFKTITIPHVVYPSKHAPAGKGACHPREGHKDMSTHAVNRMAAPECAPAWRTHILFRELFQSYKLL